MNTSTKGTLNFARLIEEAEALLMGEATNSACTGCGNCKDASGSDRCAERANAKQVIVRPPSPRHR